MCIPKDARRASLPGIRHGLRLDDPRHSPNAARSVTLHPSNVVFLEIHAGVLYGALFTHSLIHSFTHCLSSHTKCLTSFSNSNTNPSPLWFAKYNPTLVCLYSSMKRSGRSII